MSEWAVVEFDADEQMIWSSPALGEDHAREMFEYVVRRRSQRSDVVLRARSAALLHRGRVVEALGLRRSRRAPMLGNKRLSHLDVDSREVVTGLELLGTRLGWASLRRDGRPRVGPSARVARSVACQILDLVRGATSTGPSAGGWWMVEWSCHCTQVEREQASIHNVCPYHPGAEVYRGPDFVEHGW